MSTVGQGYQNVKVMGRWRLSEC